MTMASKTHIEFIDKGFQDILSSEETKSCVETIVNSIQTNAGPGFEGEVSYYGQGHRWMGFVHTTDKDSMKDEAENKTLTKAVR